VQQNRTKKRCSVDEACVDKIGVDEQLEERQQELLPVVVAAAVDVVAEPYSSLELIAGQCSAQAAVEKAAGQVQRAVVAVDIAAERQG